MHRDEMIRQLSTVATWDCCIIGGGATGLGIAIDAASRGYRTLLIEQSDFAKGTSSRSTKLVHGGVRYLQQGNIKLVMEALKERGRLRKNAPHLVKNQSFLLPNYKWWQGPFYGLGLKIYDWMAGDLGLGPSLFLSRDETLQRAPTLDPEGLRGGVLFHDGQFDDARLAINMAQTAVDQGGTMINYMKLTRFLNDNGRLSGLEATDQTNGNQYTIHARCIINATGVFTDQVRQLDQPNKPPVLSLSQGTHLVLDRKFLPGDTAILIPETSDGRVLFAVPWHQHTIIGTTDIPVSSPSMEPIPQEDEIRFILDNIKVYLATDPQRADVLAVFSGLRPLVKGNAASTAALSRDHFIEISDTGLMSITGGKWTTYRKMAEDAINQAIQHQLLPNKDCKTIALPIHGAMQVDDYNKHGYYYGSDWQKIEELIQQHPEWGETIHPDLPYTKAEIIWAVREEMCITVDDALARRTRALLLNAAAALAAAPEVAHLIALEKGYDLAWEQEQTDLFCSIAVNYLPKPLND